ncbi:MFS transporter [Paraburkholderia flava]|uniref:MFS transporter n=1 Tax=Paraburkholderia flava TaxID=2547393 RepID=UPI001061DB23|nr:MFS transporter [Paraburkholderia flava]
MTEPITREQPLDTTAPPLRRATKVRYLIVFMLFFVTTLNYADRATLSITGTAMQRSLGLSPVSMGYIFSAFAWAYVIAQLPGGWLLDRFGSKRTYAVSIFVWSILTMMQGWVAGLTVAAAVATLFVLRFLIGFAEAPAFPGNSRLVSTWFPTAERGTASAIFNSAQYFATVMFAPLMGWITHAFGWPHVFTVMGIIGVLIAALWLKTVYTPREHPLANELEIQYIEAGGGLVDLDRRRDANRSVSPKATPQVRTGACIREMLKSRMLLGVFIGQYCITTLTYFFLTWFPIYLVQERHMSILKAGFVAAIPAICGFLGGVLGGVISDALLRRGHSTTFARKVPIVAGMLLSTCMIACNYVDAQWIVVGIMALAFFGKGIGALGWAVVADTAPKQASGLCGALFNTFGNTAGITTPIVIGYLVQGTGSFAAALVFVGANALIAIACYLFVVGEIKRVELKDSLLPA